MSKHEARPLLPKGIEKRGGYSGGKPASEMGPPVKIPSGVVRPASVTSNGAAKKK